MKATNCLFILLEVVLMIPTCNSVSITLKPAKYTADDVNVHVLCQLDGQEADITNVEGMSIARKGNDTIAIMHANQTISYVAGNKDEYEAIGDIGQGKELAQSKFDLTIKTPNTEDAGRYLCFVYYKNKDGKMVEHKAVAALSVEDPEVKDMKGNLQDLLDKVEEEGDELKKITQEADQKKTKKMKDLEAKAKAQAKQLKVLLDNAKSIEKEIDEVENYADRKLKKVKETSESDLEDVNAMKDNIKLMIEEIKKKGRIINEISTRQAEDRTLLKDIEDKTKERDTTLSGLEERETAIVKKLKELAATTVGQLKKFSNLDNKESTDKSRLEGLEGITNKNEVGIQELVKNTNADELKIESLDQKLEDIDKKAEEMKASGKKPAAIKPTVKTPTRIAGSPIIAFSVANDHTSLRPTLNTVLIFPDIIVQVGQGYNPTTGIFTAPVTGLYSFHTTIYTDCISCSVRVAIMKNNEPMVKLNLGVHYDRMQGSSSAVIQLSKGDTVRLLVDKASSGVIFSGQRLSIFAGYLINVS